MLEAGIRPGSGRKWSAGAANAALAAATLGLATLLLEAGARAKGYGQMAEFVPHAGWGYLMRPSQTVWSFGLPVHINTQGLRGPEVETPKPAGRYRIVFVGDSITHGGGRVAESDLFCRRFEAWVRAGGRDVDVVNLSAPGWSPQNWRAYLETNGLLEGDALFVMLPEVDLGRPFSTMAYHDFREKAPGLRLAGFFARFLMLVYPPPRPARDVPATLRANLEATEFARHASGVRPFLVVFLPSPGGRAVPSAWDAFEAAFPDALDLRAELSATHFQDGLHLNAEGHQVVARRLLERVGPALATASTAAEETARR